MELNELIPKLREVSNMRSASHFKRTICKMAAQKLEAQQARLAQLEAELVDERYRHDRVQDFEVAEAQVLAKLQEERRWIPVRERLPEPEKRVLASDGGFVGEFYISNMGQWKRYNVNDHSLLMALDILWWMPLPEPPEEATQ